MRQVTGLYQLPETAAAPDARLRHQAIRGPPGRQPETIRWPRRGRNILPAVMYGWRSSAYSKRARPSWMICALRSREGDLVRGYVDAVRAA